MARGTTGNVARGLAGRPTTAESVLTPTLSETRLVAAQLTEDVGWNRAEVRVLSETIGGLHKRTHDVEWRTATADRAKTSPVRMLAELADLGFAWRDIARLVRVSVPAVQKWRRGEPASGESRQRLASLLAACDLIASHYEVDEIASWFEVPLSQSAPVTPISLFAADRADLVFDLASGHSDPEVLLTEFDPDWRVRYQSSFEVFEAADGHKSIRSKD